MLHQVPRSHQQQVKKRKLVFLQSSPDYCRYKNTISHQTFSDLIIIFTFMIIRMNVTAGYKGVVGRTCKTDPNRCLSIRFEGLLQLLRLHLSLTWSNYGETLKKIGKIQDLVLNFFSPSLRHWHVLCYKLFLRPVIWDEITFSWRNWTGFREAVMREKCNFF